MFGKGCQQKQVNGQKGNVEGSGHKDLLRDEPPIDGPLEHEDPSQVECPNQVLKGVGEKEGGSHGKLDGGTYHKLLHSA